jgi:hypothetical protein
VHGVLVRLGISRLRDLDRPTGERLRRPRYERATPGELIHVDVKKLGKIRPGGGWRVHGRGSAQDKARSRTAAGQVGYDYVNVAVDDHSRLSYVEVLPDEKGTTCAGFLTRAGDFFAGYGIRIQRVMSDNAFCYRHSTAFIAAVADLGLCPTLHQAALPLDQRQSRTVQPDSRPRMGLRIDQYDPEPDQGEHRECVRNDAA